MKTALKINPPWRRDRALVKLYGALNGRALLVGGVVRDALLDKVSKDIDLATPDSPETIMNLLKKAKIKAIPTGIEHGTVTAVIEKSPYQITTLRSDIETFGRKAKVAFGSDWQEDARRRDFTMNALYADLAGNIFDPLGTGLQDAKAGRVRFIGDAKARIIEDYLRILRFFRFYAYYGKGKMDEVALSACHKLRGHLAELSGERVQEELFKLLAAPNPVPVLKVMEQKKILPLILPGKKNFVRVGGDATVRLAALLPARTDVKTLSRKLRLSKETARRLEFLVKEKSNKKLKANFYLYHYGPEYYNGLAILKKQKPVKNWRKPKLPISGDDLQKLGLKEGPKLGQVLRKTENWWIEKNFKPDKKQSLTKARKLAGLA
ncbi:MAG: CCA tRNA nucleotidyltransferase [Dongiaceae bacterium]